MKYFNNRPFINNIPSGGNQPGNSNENNIWKNLAFTALGVFIGYVIKTAIDKRKKPEFNKN